jgi:hypothetical protein
MKKFFYAVAFTAMLSSSAQAQYSLGVATGNWSGTTSLYLNPANIADGRQKLVIDVASFNAGVDNNLGTLKSGIIDLLNKGKTDNLFNYSSNSSFSLMAPYAVVRGPGVMYAINPRHSVAVTTAIRGFNQFNNFNQSLYRTLNDPNYVIGGDIDLTSKNFNYTAHLWSEIGVSYAAVLVDEDEHELKAGITLRHLGGIGYVSVKGDNLDVHFRQNTDSFYAANTDLEFASNVLSTKGALTNGFSNNSILSQFFGAKAGSGWGGDIGLVYDYNPEPLRHYNIDGHDCADYGGNRYLLRVSAALTDLGSISYKAANNSNAVVTGNGFITGNGLKNNVTNFNDFRSYALAQGFTADTAHAKTKVYMPSALHIGADYHVSGHYYVNGTFIGNIANRQNFGNSVYNQFTLTPRYDTRLLSVGVPVTYNTLAHNFRLGVGVRFTGFFIGSDDMMALFSKNQYGFNIYAGGFIPFNYHRPKDSDGDGISDKNDGCPYEYGRWENHGCPDKDQEHEHGKDKDKDDDDSDK